MPEEELPASNAIESPEHEDSVQPQSMNRVDFSNDKIESGEVEHQEQTATTGSQGIEEFTHEDAEIDNNSIEKTNELSNSSNKPYRLVNLFHEARISFADTMESDITCIQAWELNLYIGTSTGEIIHFYKIDEELGYIQISRQKFSSSFANPVKKLILLPEISIALAHCGSSMCAYTLPELSPANIGKAKEVTDLCIDWKDLKLDKKKENTVTKTGDYHGEPFVKVTLFTRKAIRLLRIFKDGIRLHKEFQYTGVQKGLQLGNYSVVSNIENYDLIDISQSEKFFLFPLSTSSSHAELSPIIEFVNDKEALLVCGGEKENDPAMGMFINTNGDVVRGTLAFEKYPRSVCVQYPYVLVTMEKKIIVYSIFDQSILQNIEIPDLAPASQISITTTNRIFELRDHALTSKITLAPIISTMDNAEMERITVETDKATKKSICVTSCIVFDSRGQYLKLLKPISDIDKWLEIFDGTTVENADASYEKLMSYFSANRKNLFLIELIGLFTLSFKLFDQAFEIWTANFEHIDPRLMMYIFNDGESDGIYGSVWTYLGLFERIKELKEKEKSKEMVDFYRLYLNTCLTVDFENDSVNIGKSLEVALVKLGLANNEDLDHVIHEIKYSSNEIIELFLLNKRYYLLSKLYSKLDDHRQWLYYWKGMLEGSLQDEEFSQNFGDINKALQLFVNYILVKCADEGDTVKGYIEWLLNYSPSYGLKLITDKRMNSVDISEMRALKLLDEATVDVAERRNYKLQYLEYAFHQKKKKQFAGDLVLLYLDSIKGFYDSNEEVRRALKGMKADYMALNIPKVSLMKYWTVFKRTHLNSSQFIEHHDRLCLYLNYIGANMKTVLDQVPVLRACEKQVLQSEYKDVLPLLSLMLYFRLKKYVDLVSFLIVWKDYVAAESFAVNLNLDFLEFSNPDLEQVVSLNTGGKVLWDENDLDSDSPTVDTLDDEKLSELLLKNIFDSYLKNNETEMIDNFLNKFDLLNDTTLGASVMPERMDRFVEMLDKVPDSFPLDRLMPFLTRNLLEFEDYNTNTILKKSLIKAEVNKMANVSKGFISKESR